MGVGEKHNNFSLKLKKKAAFVWLLPALSKSVCVWGGSPRQPLAPVESCASFPQLERVSVSENEIQPLISLGSFIVNTYLCL